ncbi:MAG TPA: hypothetical protein VM869_26980 [Enhygromyxa sp.]|nr:hypothetical protein [Enhygromyxa sp.]
MLAVAIALSTSACRCGAEPDQPVASAPELAPEPRASEPKPAPTPARARDRLVVADASQLAELDLGPVESLDLALSELDAQERPLPLPEPSEPPAPSVGETGGEPVGDATPPVESRCAGLDLHEIAERAPQLISLRISGCQAAVHAGLSAFGERLRELELVDLELDAVTVARLSQLHGLDTLILTRVHAEPDALKPLGRKISPRSVTLRELQKDSAVAELFGILRDLREIRLIGPWATHNTMIQVGKAKRLERLAVIDTEIGNYSLHQIKPLDQLRRIEWSGSGFTDGSPVFMKELPIEELVCNCPRFGDRGLQQLYLFENLRTLELERSSVTSAGLVNLGPLQQLEHVTLRYVDLDADGFTALAQLSRLTKLVLGPGRLLDPKATGLGLLITLRELVIGLEGFGDEAAPQLATLVELEQLDLGETAISDEGLEHLAPLTKLVRLELHHTRVTKHGLAHLAGMQALEVLELDHTDVVDEGVAHLATLGSLRELRLDRTLITDAALPHLLKLERLERLNLAETVVTREGVAVLQQLDNLRAVNLAGTRAR